MISSASPIGRDPARQLARQELSKAIYHPAQSFPAVIADAIGRFLRYLASGAASLTPGGAWTVTGICLLAIVIVAVAIRLARLSRAARRAAPLQQPGSAPASAAQLRASAASHADAGDYRAAIVDRVRAISASCEELGILPADAGRTADELAAQAGARFPGYRADLARCARLFDELRYGDREGTQPGYVMTARLDDALAASRATAPVPG